MGHLLLGQPPPEALPIADYRTVADFGVHEPSPDLLDTLTTMVNRQQWMREYRIEMGCGPLPFIGSVQQGEMVEPVAARMRQAFGLTAGWAQQHAKWEDALRDLLDKCESLGIIFSVNGIVENNTKRALDPEEFRGFVLVDQIAPLIFINGADAKSAQMFTLAHELAHLWCGQSALFNIPGLAGDRQKPLESFCNSVAAEFLVPAVELLAFAPQIRMRGAAAFDGLTKNFKVSALVLARKALDLGLIPNDDYWAFYRTRIASDRTKTAAPGGDFFATQRFRLGRPFSTAVARSARSGSLLYRDAYRLLGMKRDTYEKWVTEIGVDG